MFFDIYDGVNTSHLVTLMLSWTSDVSIDDVKRVEKLDFEIVKIKYSISFRQHWSTIRSSTSIIDISIFIAIVNNLKV